MIFYHIINLIIKLLSTFYELNYKLKIKISNKKNKHKHVKSKLIAFKTIPIRILKIFNFKASSQ